MLAINLDNIYNVFSSSNFMSHNAIQLKEQIISIFKRRGPSLPIHISKETGLDLLFASAFLSELIGGKMVKISIMKIGSSPLYFLPGQEHLLENFIEFLNKKEREAFLLLKEKKFLKDSEQEPAIRVALRAIKDFAFESRRNDELYWKFLRADDSEFVAPKQKDEIEEMVVEPEVKKIEEVEIPIVEAVKKEEAKKPVKTAKKSAPRKKQDDKFFNRVKEFIDSKNAEIVEIISASPFELILKIKIGHKEKILVAYKKKTISEKDIISAYRKSKKYELPFLVTSMGETSKSLAELIDAVRILTDIERVK